MYNLHETASGGVLSAGEPHPLETFRETARSDYFLICEHAGNRIPAKLGTMGLSPEDRERHIAWDIGARSVAVALSDLLNAPLYAQRYSRLVCDCNRRPDAIDFAPVRSEATEIPANRGITDREIEARADAVFWPFHDAVAAALDAREAEGVRTRLVTIHSFTPVFFGEQRPWEIGVLFNRDRDFAPAIARWLQANTGLSVGINQPYNVSDETDYAIPVHGEQRGLPCVELEIRNDLIGSRDAARQWAELISRALAAAKL